MGRFPSVVVAARFLLRQGWLVNRKRVQRLMRVMGLMGLAVIDWYSRRVLRKGIRPMVERVWSKRFAGVRFMGR